MLFNLLPVPPLDGSRVVADFVPAYRRLISGEAVRGLMTAVFFAMFLGGASYIFRAAYAASDGVIYAIAGRERVRVVRPDPVSEDAATDTAPDSMPSPTQPAAERL
jgi:Zn-dependent protease